MPDEAYTAPVYDGLYMTFAGRRMLRVQGGDGTEEEVVEDTPTDDSAPDESPETTGTRADDDLDPDHLAGQDDVDWEKRYRDLHPEFTKSRQELGTLRQRASLADALENPQTREEAFRQLAEQLGYELDGEETEEDDLENVAEEQFHDPRVDELLAAQQQRDHQEAMGQLTDHVKELADEKGVELTDRQRNALINDAVAAGFNREATEKVFEDWVTDLKSYEDKVIEKYRTSKKKVPSVPPPGSAGTPQVDLADPEKRLERANAVVERHYAGS